GDVNHDGKADVVTGAGPGGGPNVKVFRGTDLAVLQSYYAYAPSFAGGVRVGVRDVNGDGYSDVITGAGPGGGPPVGVFDGRSVTVIREFFAYDPTFLGGVQVG